MTSHTFAAVLACAAVLALPAKAADLSFTDTFTGAGGDASYGGGDVSTVLNVGLDIPFFDPAWGTLQQVSFQLSGWRELELTCTAGIAGATGSCNARVDALFNLYVPQGGGSYTVALINPRQAVPTFYTPRLETTPAISDTLSASDSASGGITDPALLGLFVQDGSSDQFRLSFYANDGGYFGDGGGVGFTKMLWDADASATVTYTFLPAVPEPGTLVLMAGGLAAVAWRRRQQPAR
ncbi:MAG: choice-of-anchor E domain-containing protein [Burkholderiaceae bacterium]|nr:choice-of-anchor E domain-containing protein [Burkholderiaceae bacterium]